MLSKQAQHRHVNIRNCALQLIVTGKGKIKYKLETFGENTWPHRAYIHMSSATVTSSRDAAGDPASLTHVMMSARLCI